MVHDWPSDTPTDAPSYVGSDSHRKAASIDTAGSAGRTTSDLKPKLDPDAARELWKKKNGVTSC
jgi:hypothetical protein